MRPAVNEPFLLASYQYRHRKHDGKSSKKPLNSVYVSSASSSKLSEGYATVTVQGDGVHILDVCSFPPSRQHSKFISSLAVQLASCRLTHPRTNRDFRMSRREPTHHREWRIHLHHIRRNRLRVHTEHSRRRRMHYRNVERKCISKFGCISEEKSKGRE
jgi:hypothetical protein